MEDEIDLPFHEQVVRDIVVDELEAWVSSKMGDIIGAACDQVVDTYHGVPFCNESIAQVRTEKAGASGHNGNRHSQFKESKQTLSR